jgi:hypothetical protein
MLNAAVLNRFKISHMFVKIHTAESVLRDKTIRSGLSFGRSCLFGIVMGLFGPD